MEKNIKQQNISANKNGGFIALITAILLTVILLVAVTSLNENGFFVRSEVLDSEYKNASQGLAEACISSAILSLAKDPTYSVVDESISVGSDSCTLDTIELDTPPGMVTISASAVYPSGVSQGAVTRIQVVVDATDFSVIEWKECLAVAPAMC